MKSSSLTGLSILIIEDEVLLRKQLTAALQGMGADVTTAGTVAAARNLIESLSFDYALLDVNLPDGLGTELLKQKQFASSTGVIVMTADGAVGGAVEAMKLGALDYMVKPFDSAELPLVIARVRRAKQNARLDEHRRDAPTKDEFFFGRALAEVETQLQRILIADQRIQGTPAPVLILGETGTGKTSIARWLHRRGPRGAFPLVEVNCSAFPETLAEAELFGHERGAFTDARAGRLGLFEAADGGTLFLDELPSLSLPTQAKVLTAIEDQRIRRLGANKMVEVDVRVIAASNRDLKELVAAGQFREDLYHRLDLFRINLPALRERGADIIRMASTLLERLCRRHGLVGKSISPLGESRLLAYPWPGNVRELSHEIERSIVFSEQDVLDFERLPASVPPPNTPAASASPSSDWLNTGFVFPPQGFELDQAIDRLVQHALKQAGENVSAAARLLGVSRDVVRYRLSGQREKQKETPESASSE